MIEAAKDKLEEALFFLGHLQDYMAEQAQPRKPPREISFYYLSAFLSAAKSVTSIVERDDEAWFRSWKAQLTETEDALKKLATDMRNDTVHEGRLRTTPRSEEVPIPMSPDPYQGNIARRAHALHLRQQGGPWTMREVHYVEFQGTAREVVSVCEQYVQLLAKLIKDFEDKHPE